MEFVCPTMTHCKLLMTGNCLAFALIKIDRFSFAHSHHDSIAYSHIVTSTICPLRRPASMAVSFVLNRLSIEILWLTAIRHRHAERQCSSCECMCDAIATHNRLIPFAFIQFKKFQSNAVSNVFACAEITASSFIHMLIIRYFCLQFFEFWKLNAWNWWRRRWRQWCQWRLAALSLWTRPVCCGDRCHNLFCGTHFHSMRMNEMEWIGECHCALAKRQN